jgi:hypothetical protein
MAIRHVAVIYVSQPGQVNLRVGVTNGVWGFKRPQPDLSTLQSDDWVLFGSGYTGGNPRVSTEEWPHHALGSLLVGRVRRGMYEDSEQVWPDEHDDTSYQHRFRWELADELHDVSLGAGGLEGAIAEGFRLSALGGGRGILVEVEDQLMQDLSAPGVGSGSTSTFSEVFGRILDLQASYASTNTPEMQERGELVRVSAPELLGRFLSRWSGHSSNMIAAQGRDGIGRKS